MSELLRALGALCERPTAETARLARLLELPGEPDPAEWTALFVRELPPYASLYLGHQGMLGGEARDRVGGFWRALALEPPPEPDHLASLLGLAGALAEAGQVEPEPARAALLRSARRALVEEHVASWLPPYLERALALASPFYRAWALLVAEAVEAERAPEPRAAPLAHRDARRLEHPDDVGLDAFVGQLATPVRSGLVLTPSDLGGMARELGLGVRPGGRRLALRSLLDQNAPATLTRLGAAAAERARRLDGFWEDRLAACVSLLADCAEAAAGAAVR